MLELKETQWLFVCSGYVIFTEQNTSPEMSNTEAVSNSAIVTSYTTKICYKSFETGREGNASYCSLEDANIKIYHSCRLLFV
jgi:hypothetical protein